MFIGIVILIVFVAAVTVFLVLSKPQKPYPTPHSIEIVNDNLTINGGAYQHFNFSLSNSATVNPTIDGTFNVSDGQSIRVYVMDKANFVLWQNQKSADTFYDSGVINNDQIRANLPNDDYVLVFDNTFASSSKTINTNVLRWQV